MTTPPTSTNYLMAYFHTELEADGERIRFAVSEGARPDRWRVLNGGHPVLTSGLGTGGARDPFLVRDERAGKVFVLATDLRTWPDHDPAWSRAVQYGSRSILVWESTDLTTWSEPSLIEVAPDEVGNVWAPKAFWSHERQTWLVFWASAIFDPGTDRAAGSYQRIMVAETADFRTFTTPRVHLDLGHDVIDLTFIQDGPHWYRFSANAHVPGGSPDLGKHIFMETGPSLDEPDFQSVTVDIGKEALQRGEGPAVIAGLEQGSFFLFIDEFLLRGYQLFETKDLASGTWTHLPGADMPAGARHGSVLSITADEKHRLLRTYP